MTKRSDPIADALWEAYKLGCPPNESGGPDVQRIYWYGVFGYLNKEISRGRKRAAVLMYEEDGSDSGSSTYGEWVTVGAHLDAFAEVRARVEGLLSAFIAGDAVSEKP